MKLGTSEFCVRYFHWSRSQFEEQIKGGFPDLATFTSGIAWKTRNIMTLMSTSEQLDLSSVMLSRAHPIACSLLGIHPTREALLLDQRLDLRIRMYPPGLDKSPPTRFSKRVLKQLIRRQFLDVHGASCKQLAVENGENGIEFEMPCENVFIRTWFYFGPRDRCVEYGHGIREKSEKSGTAWNPPIEGGSNISLLSWLGMSSQTSWPNVMDTDAELICETAVELCSRFLLAAPKLLTGS